MTGVTPPFPPRPKGAIPITDLLGRASRSLLEVWSDEMFHNRGTVVEVLGQRLMVFNRPEAIEAILVTQAANFPGKPPQLRKLLAPLMGEGLFVAEGAGALRRRPPVAAALAGCPAHLWPGLHAVAGDWTKGWATLPPGATIDIMAEMERCAAEVLCRSLFGAAVTRGAAGEIARLAEAYRGQVTGGRLIAMLAMPESLARLRVRGDAKRIHAAVDGWLERSGQAQGSLAAILATAPGMTPERLRDEVISLFSMGHDALTGLLATAWFLLAEAPATEAALHAEWRGVLGGRMPAAEDMPRLPMTRAVLMEALRLYPPVPLFGRIALGDTQVAGVPAPKGSLAMVAPWVLHRHHAHWEAPDEFRPERFLPDAPPPAPFTYLPFGAGPRHCPAEAMTLNAAMLMLAALGQAFRLCALPGHSAAPRAGLTLRLAEKLPMRLERR